MWKVVYIAQTAEAAARIKEVLAANGFLTQTKTTNSKHGGVYEISVPLSEAEDAYGGNRSGQIRILPSEKT